MKTNKSMMFIIIVVSLLTFSCFAIESRQDTPGSLRSLETNNEFTVIWTVSDIYEYSMVGAPGRIIIHGWKSGDIATSRLIALDSTNGDTVWTTSKSIDGIIITQDEFLYHGTSGTAKVRAHDTKTGDLLWDTRLPWAHSVDTLSFGEGRIYVHTNDFEYFILTNQGEFLDKFRETFRVFYQTDNVLYIEDVLGIQAVDASSKEKIWGLELGTRWSIPIFDGGTIFLSTLSKDGDVLSVKQTTGEINWKESQDVLSNLYVVSENIYFISYSGHLVTLDSYSGEEISRVKFSPSFDLDQQNGGYFVTGDPTNNVLAVSFGDNAQIIGLKIENP